jgi:hypothetical protein
MQYIFRLEVFRVWKQATYFKLYIACSGLAFNHGTVGCEMNPVTLVSCPVTSLAFVVLLRYSASYNHVHE